MTSAMTSRRDEIIRLRKEGQTHAEIGRRFDITKERVKQTLTPKPPKPAPKKPAPRPKVMLKTGEAAQLLGLHPNTVRRWSEKGMLEVYRCWNAWRQEIPTRGHRCLPRGSRQRSQQFRVMRWVASMP